MTTAEQTPRKIKDVLNEANNAQAVLDGISTRETRVISPDIGMYAPWTNEEKRDFEAAIRRYLPPRA